MCTQTLPLTADEIETFHNDGYVVLKECFSRDAAAELVNEAYAQLGYDPNDPTTWEKPLAFLFPERKIPIREFSPKLWDGICQLIGGENRAADPNCTIGQWVINFTRGRDEEWQAPSAKVRGWHKDGNAFRHFLDSPEQGLLVVPLFTDVGYKGGGTVIAADSVAPVARFLADRPAGVVPRTPANSEPGFDYPGLLAQCHDFREFTGRVGDVALIHPYLLHSSSQNHSGIARFITNINIVLKDPMILDRPNPADYSPVELSILRALGVENYPFEPQGERMIFGPVRYN